MQSRKVRNIALLLLGVLAAFVVALSFWPMSPSVKRINTKVSSKANVKFKKEAELFIYKASGDTLKSLEIEVADNDFETSQGLMYRKSMAENRGMLFIQPREEVQSFWMRNTHISLDIIYVNADFEIVSVQKYTTPYSETSLLSDAPAKYVLEVNAGMFDKWGLNVGDKISFKRI